MWYLAVHCFVDSFTVIRRVQGVDTTGRMTETDTSLPGTGVVYPVGQNTQERTHDFATGHKSIIVITDMTLRPQTLGFVPDLVTWRGNNYLVQTLDDFTNLGRGFVQAFCTSQDLQDAPPEGGNAQ